MTAADYLDNGDFRCFCSLWAESGTPPFPLSDWLRDRGLESQADAVDEALAGVFNIGEDVGPRRPWKDPFKNHWRWMLKGGGDLRFRSELPVAVFSRLSRRCCIGGYANPAVAIADYLDAYAAATAGVPQ